uniref:Serine aminopeptidase S33 domain-containing protein n=1 Tax=Haptolina ericina TaxID=156174 RepID=A0A7S3FEZ7_9EUKA
MLLILLARLVLVRRLLATHDPSLSAPLPPSLTVEGVEEYLRERDEREAPLKPGGASNVRWAKGVREQAEVVVVFVHGFSAGVREVDPVDEQMAAKIGATLLRFRLSAHGISDLGRAGAALKVATRDVYLRDIAIAFALAKLLGRRVVLAGCSTGGSLAVWLAAQPWVGEELAALVLFAPGFAIAKLGTAVYDCLKWLVLLLPRAASETVLNTLNGPINRVPVISEEQKTIWTMAYPTSAIRHVIGIYVSIEVGVKMRRLRLPVLAFANPADKVVDFGRTKSNLHLMPRGRFESVTDSEMAHTLTGPLSPSSVDFCASCSAQFLIDNGIR